MSRSVLSGTLGIQDRTPVSLARLASPSRSALFSRSPNRTGSPPFSHKTPHSIHSCTLSLIRFFLTEGPPAHADRTPNPFSPASSPAYQSLLELKIIFLGPVEGVSSVLRPHWEEVGDGRVLVVQVQPHILEIIPTGTSKADGVKVLLDHLGISPKEIMAIGTGENDVEMLELASLGVALGNGSEKAKAVADVIGSTNDDDGAAMAIYQYAF